MKKGIPILLMLSLSLVFLCSYSFAEEKKQAVEREGPFDTTSIEMKEQYQSVNAAIIATMITPDEFPGPFAGPGYYVGMNGPLVSIAWLQRKDKEETEIKPKRYIPIGSILATGQPIHLGKGPDRYVVYYKGPFGETEFFILVDMQNKNEEKSNYEKFINRWKSYLLSQEPTT